MTTELAVPEVDIEALRCEIRNEYAEVAANPGKGFHFHTGRALAAIVGYDEALLDGIPEGAVESFAGTGFEDFEITWRAAVFDGAPQASSAAYFGTMGINFRARKP